jgi:hypothetical protein
MKMVIKIDLETLEASTPVSRAGRHRPYDREHELALVFLGLASDALTQTWSPEIKHGPASGVVGTIEYAD